MKRIQSWAELCITKTYLYNFDPLKPHFYIVKLGFTGVYIIFLISAQKHRFWVLFFYCHTTPPRLFELEPWNCQGNSPMDEDWRNAFGILMCAEICNGIGPGICNGAPMTCSSYTCTCKTDTMPALYKWTRLERSLKPTTPQSTKPKT